MAHLGSLGTPKGDTTVTFDYFGTEITSTGVTDTEYLDFMEDVEGLASNDPRLQRFVKSFARICFGEEQFEEFWRVAKANKQNTDDIFDVLTKVLEASAGRPTEQPSDSSDGQPSTEPKSTGSSSSLQARLAGRPDLELLVFKAQEARAS